MRWQSLDSFAKVEVIRCAETIELTAKELINLHGETINTDATPSGREALAYYKRVPAGVASLITPFNFPLNLVAHKLAPAIGAGDSVVLKPTPEAPLCAYELAKLFIESEYAIEDAISVVYGDAEVGGELVSNPIPRVVSFTGSVQVGKIIMQNAGIKKVALELGGNAATFIDSSADLKIQLKSVPLALSIIVGKFVSLYRESMSIKISMMSLQTPLLRRLKP